VRANNRWSSEEIKGQENPSRVYTLRCNKPEMAVSVQPGNIWTKEFTIDELTVTTGDPKEALSTPISGNTMPNTFSISALSAGTDKR